MAATSRPAISAVRAGPTLRVQLAIVVTVAVVVPLLAIAVFGARQIAQREDRGARRAMELSAEAIVRSVNPLIGEHLRAVSSIAQSFSASTSSDPSALDAALLRARKLYPGFLTMLAADSAGMVIAAAPSTDSSGRKLVTRLPSIADRPYFRIVMESGMPFVSDVFLGRGFGSDPIVALAAPLVGASGRRVGIVEGSLDLSSIARLQEPAQFVPTDFVLLDATDRVIFATPRTGYGVLQSLKDSPLAAARRASNEDSFRYSERGVEFLATAVSASVPGWHVVIRQRRSDVRQTTTNFLRGLLVVFAGGLVLCILLAWRMAVRVTRPLESLDGAVREFLTTGSPDFPTASGGTPREVATLVDGFREMQRRLGLTLSGLLPVCAWCRRIRDDQDTWLAMEAYLTQRSNASFTHGICPDCSARIEP